MDGQEGSLRADHFGDSLLLSVVHKIPWEAV